MANTLFSGTVEVGTPELVTIDSRETDTMQVDVTGAGSLLVETTLRGQSASNSQGTFSAETIILDMIDVNSILLTASVADVPTVISSYKSGGR